MAKKIVINKNLCKGCGLCIEVCPKKLLKLSDELNIKGLRVVVIEDDSECTSCALCAINCPDLAIEVFKK